eukprot:471189-Lingulodinium_polyedra.AAC.1
MPGKPGTRSQTVAGRRWRRPINVDGVEPFDRCADARRVTLDEARCAGYVRRYLAQLLLRLGQLTL